LVKRRAESRWVSRETKQESTPLTEKIPAKIEFPSRQVPIKTGVIVFPRISVLLALCALSLLAGCRKSAPPAPPGNAALPAASAPKKPTPLTEAELAKIRPNEVGVVPILEYHDISPGANRMDRSVKAFRQDLERLYKNDYRPITLRSYLENRIDLPPGKSPVILTFDDARGSQFRYKPDRTLDPNCAMGIMQEFARKHPDFPVRAMFFVLPNRAFDQPDTAQKKMQELVDMGCEIGNHTVNHPILRRLSDEKVQSEIAQSVMLVKRMVPNVEMDTLALPGGVPPRNLRLLASGQYKDWKYQNRAALLAGAEPAFSPVSKKYKPMSIPRVLAIEGFMGVTYWLNYLKSRPTDRYVSDGDPETVTVPKAFADEVDKAKLQGATLRLY
jgi:peptidoglycan/xylan/chitin deacetylase (PgdA/CDA1 family)